MISEKSCDTEDWSNDANKIQIYITGHLHSKIYSIKGLLHPKMKILSLITYPHVVPNP